LSAARLSLPPDPRLFRSPSWSQDAERGRAVGKIAWGLTLATLVVLLPGWTLYGMIARRRWSLRQFLLLPLLVGLIVIVLRVPLPTSVEPQTLNSVSRRLSTAITFAPLLIFLTLLIEHARRQRWRWLLGWSLAVLPIAVFMAAMTLLFESRHLAPGERFTLSDLDIPLANGFYATAWLATVVAALAAVLRRFRPRSSEQGSRPAQ